MKFRITLFSVLFLFVLTCYPQRDEKLKVLESKIEQALKDFNVTGASVGIIKNGSVEMLKGFGYADKEAGKKVTPNTIFGLASVSKAFTAAALGILVDDKKLEWDDKVIKYLPGFALSDPYITKEMNIRDLLSHRSGLGTFDGDLLWYGTDYSREEVVNRIRYQPIKYSFRSRYGYQNIMFIAAGEVVEEISGSSWDEFLADNIFNPLGMKNTNTSTGAYKEGMDWSKPYVNGEETGFIDYDNSGPAASINSSAEDMLNWLSMWLNKGVYNGDTVLTPGSIRTITAPHTIVYDIQGKKPGDTHFMLYGLGWVLMDYSGRKVIHHSGGLPGVHTKAVLVPEDSLGIIILANEISPMVDPLMYEILDIYLGDKGKEYLADAYKRYSERKKPEEETKETRPLTLPASAYTGIYEDEMYGRASVTEHNGTLTLKLLPTEKLFTSTLRHTGNGSFEIKFNDSYLPKGSVNFEISGEKAQAFKIDLPNPDFWFHELNFKRIAEE